MNWRSVLENTITQWADGYEAVQDGDIVRYTIFRGGYLFAFEIDYKADMPSIAWSDAFPTDEVAGFMEGLHALLTSAGA